MQPELVSIIIATYSNESGLKECLASLRVQSYLPIEIIVVLNGCIYNAREIIAREAKEAKVIINQENLFFARAQNQGIGAAKGRYIFCLNDDCVIEPNYISEALKPFYMDDNIGMVTGKILRSDKMTIDTTGLFLGKSRRPVERGYGKKDNGQYENNGYVFGICAGCGLYRRKMLEGVKDEYGYFDNRFKMFYEDLDLAWRANKKGWRGYYVPQAIAYHKRGGSAKTLKYNNKPLHGIFAWISKLYFAQLSAELQKDLLKNRWLTILKNDSFFGFVFNFPFILVYELKLRSYLLARNLGTVLGR